MLQLLGRASTWPRHGAAAPFCNRPDAELRPLPHLGAHRLHTPENCVHPGCQTISHDRWGDSESRGPSVCPAPLLAESVKKAKALAHMMMKGGEATLIDMAEADMASSIKLVGIRQAMRAMLKEVKKAGLPRETAQLLLDSECGATPCRLLVALGTAGAALHPGTQSPTPTRVPAHADAAPAAVHGHANCAPAHGIDKNRPPPPPPTCPHIHTINAHAIVPLRGGARHTPRRLFRRHRAAPRGRAGGAAAGR